MPCDGQDDRYGPHDGPGRQPRPIQNLHAKVRASWTSVRSSDTTPTRRNATHNNRSTLHHSIGPGRTQIPPSTAVLASVIRESARHTKPYGSTRDGRASVITPPSPAHTIERSEQSPRPVPKSPNLVFNPSDNSRFNFHLRHHWRFRYPNTRHTRLAGETNSPASRNETWHDTTRTITF
jgi:hypothetical protein